MMFHLMAARFVCIVKQDFGSLTQMIVSEFLKTVA